MSQEFPTHGDRDVVVQFALWALVQSRRYTVLHCWCKAEVLCFSRLISLSFL